MRKAARKSDAERASEVASLPVRGHRVGRVVGMRDGQWLVECAANMPPLLARTTLTLGAQQMQEAASAQREALIVFENELATRPIVVGLLAPPPTEVIDVTVDGKRVTLDARDEIVLRCGSASLTLRRNGRVVIRGTYVETRAQGVNRVKGGTVLIN